MLGTIRAVVGHDVMQDFFAEFGGSEVWIPRFPDADHWTSRLFGEHKAREITRQLNVHDADGKVVGNLRCYVPSINNRLIQFKLEIEHEIREALMSGKSIRDIVRDVRTTERQVHRQKRSLEEAGLLPRPVKVERPKRAKTAKRRDLDNSVDEAILNGFSNSAIARLLPISRWSILHRRRLLIASGKLEVGRRGGGVDRHDASRHDSGPISESGEVAP